MAEICEDLPDECWELIFNQLNHHSYSESLSLVCKRFLSITDRLRTSFAVVDATTLSHGNLSNLFSRRFPNIKSINLSCFPGDLALAIRQIAASSLNLEALDVSRNKRLRLEGLKLLGLNMKNLRALNCANLGNFRDAELAAIANSMPSLEELDISNPRNALCSDLLFGPLIPGKISVTDEGIELLSLKVRGLRKINLSGNAFLTDRSLVALSSNCTLLNTLFVLGCSFITHNGIQALVRSSPNLSSLAVDGCQIRRPPMFLQILDSLGGARGLSTLELSDSSISDGCLHSLGKSGIPLKRFSLLFCNNFTFSGISSLLHAYQSLECLAFTGVSFITDHHMSDLSTYLRSSVKIELISCCMLTDSTLFTLAKNCPLLEDIHMVGTNLGGGESYMGIIKNKRIKSLNLASNSNMSDKCLGRIASVCPSVELLDVSCCLGITENGIADFLKSSSKMRHLLINECRGIKNIGSGFELPKLEVLQAARSGMDDEGLAMIGDTCCGLLNFDLEGCLKVTAVGLMEMLLSCRRLKKINLNRCDNVGIHIIERMVYSSSSLRKIIAPNTSFPNASQQNLFLRHGCLVSQGG